MKDIKVGDENHDFLWEIKRKNKLKSMDEVISFLIEKLKELERRE